MSFNRDILFALLLVQIGALSVSSVHADGVFVWNRESDLNQPSQKAIVYFEGSKEVLILQVKYEGSAEDFGWIVPFPSKPKVTAIDATKDPFGEISLYTQTRARWGLRSKGEAIDTQEVTLLEHKVVGVYDVAILTAKDASALSEWLNSNGYLFPEKRSDVLEYYTQKNWFYVAMRIDKKALRSDEIKKLRIGELQPIRFSFTSKEMVYPMKITSVNNSDTEVLLYLLSNAPMVLKEGKQKDGLSIETNMPYYFGKDQFVDLQYGTFRKVTSSELPLTWEAMELPEDIKLSLCKYRAVYSAEEMENDLIFTRFTPLPYWKRRLQTSQKNDIYSYFRKRLALNVLAFHDASILDKYGKHRDPQIRQSVAENARVTQGILERLSEDQNVDVRQAVARNTNTPHAVLDKLSHDSEINVRGEVARNIETPPKILEALADDYFVKGYAAENPNTPTKVLSALANDKSHTVRAKIASHRKTPIGNLSQLAKDKSEYVRSHVAQNPHTPPDVLETLANDINSTVRYGVAHNPNTPTNALRKLAKDTDLLTSRAARMRLTKVSDSKSKTKE